MSFSSSYPPTSGGAKSPANKTPTSKTPLAAFKEQQRTREKMATRGNEIEFIHNRLNMDLKEIEQELRNDRKAKEEYTKQLAKHEARKTELRKLIQQQEEFTIQFDQQIGPFESKYHALQHSVDGLHKDAIVKYDAALQLLVDKLHYNPAFKRWNDTI